MKKRDAVTGVIIKKNPLNKTKLNKMELDEIFNNMGYEAEE